MPLYNIEPTQLNLNQLSYWKCPNPNQSYRNFLQYLQSTHLQKKNIIDVIIIAFICNHVSIMNLVVLQETNAAKMAESKLQENLKKLQVSSFLYKTVNILS
jgi:hypothetical protein